MIIADASKMETLTQMSAHLHEIVMHIIPCWDIYAEYYEQGIEGGKSCDCFDGGGCFERKEEGVSGGQRESTRRVQVTHAFLTRARVLIARDGPNVLALLGSLRTQTVLDTLYHYGRTKSHREKSSST